MLEVSPFEAIRYNSARLGCDMSAFIAPPYDVLDEVDKQRLLGKSSQNIVAVDLPFIPPKAAGPAAVYERSAELLREWLREGILIRESEPSFYVYHQRFSRNGTPYTRRMFIARLRLESFSTGVILPHEQTFGGPKEDRLALMKATKCQLSPIFGLFSDPNDRISSILSPTADRTPDVTGALESVQNLMWLITDRGVIDKVVLDMQDKKVYIADGHHRYGTALMYRDWVAQNAGGKLPVDHPSNFVMFVLASMDDPGCLILPYFRAIEGTDSRMLLEAWSAGTSRANESQAVSRPEADIVVFDGRSGVEMPLRFTRRNALRELEPNQVAPWYELDYAYLHRYLIDELLTKKLGHAPKLHYLKSAEDAKQAAREHRGVALLVNATPMAHLRAVSEAGGLMPQKSTYFYPKLATGMTMNPLT